MAAESTDVVGHSATARWFASWADHPGLCLAAAAVVTAVAVAGYRLPDWPRDLLERAGLIAADETEEPPSSSQRGRRFGGRSRSGQGDAILVVEADDFFTPAAAAALRDVVERLEALDQVAGVTWLDRAPPLNIFGLAEPILPRGNASAERFAVARRRALEHPLVVGQMLSPDGRTTLLTLRLDWVFVQDDADVTSELVETARQAAAAHPDVRFTFSLTGSTPIRLEAMRSRESDERTFQLLGYGMILVLSAVLFRGVSVVLVTAAAPALGVFWALGLVRTAGLQENPFSHVILPVLLSLVGFTDAVHMMVAVRRGLAAGLPPREACRHALANIGLACFLTSLTTAIGMGSLYLAHHQVVREFGGACVLGVAATWLSVMTVIPLACRTPWARRLAAGAGSEPVGRQLERLDPVIDRILRRAPQMSLVAVGLLLMLGGMSLRLQPDDRKARLLPEGSEGQRALEQLDRALGGLDTCTVEIRWPDREASPAEVVDVVEAVDATIASEPLLSHPFSIRRLVAALPGEAAARDKMGLVELLPPPLKRLLFDPAEHIARVTFRVPDQGTVAAKPTFERLDAALTTLATAHPGFEFTLSGDPIWRWRDLYRVVMDLTSSLGTASLVIFVVLGVAFRSVRLGMISIVPNLLPLAAAAASLVVTGQPLEIVSVCALTVCLGIAVDDTIHFLARYRIEQAAGREPGEAIRRSISEVGTGLVMTTLVLLAGFGAVMISANRDHRAFAVMGLVTLSTALVCDLLFLPALLATFDRTPATPAAEAPVRGR